MDGVWPLGENNALQGRELGGPWNINEWALGEEQGKTTKRDGRSVRHVLIIKVGQISV